MSDKKESTLKRFMKSSTRHSLGDQPTTHRNCMDVTGGVARPGKTARDKANGLTVGRNIRFPEGKGK
jgi:hypothetical protein